MMIGHMLKSNTLATMIHVQAFVVNYIRPQCDLVVIISYSSFLALHPVTSLHKPDNDIHHKRNHVIDINIMMVKRNARENFHIGFLEKGHGKGRYRVLIMGVVVSYVSLGVGSMLSSINNTSSRSFHHPTNSISGWLPSAISQIQLVSHHPHASHPIMLWALSHHSAWWHVSFILLGSLQVVINGCRAQV